MLDNPNPWGEEQGQTCRSLSPTHSVLTHSVDEKHEREKRSDDCKAESSKNVQDKVGKLDKVDKGMPKGLPKGLMFIQLPKHSNVNVSIEEPCITSAAATERTPLLVSKDAPIRNSPKPAGSWKESKEVTKEQKPDASPKSAGSWKEAKAQKKQTAKERRKAASSSQTLSEPINSIPLPQLPNTDISTPTPQTESGKTQTKEMMKDQRKKEKEERKAESLRRKEESVRRKQGKKGKRYGLGNVVAAGDEGGSGMFLLLYVLSSFMLYWIWRSVLI